MFYLTAHRHGFVMSSTCTGTLNIRLCLTFTVTRILWMYKCQPSSIRTIHCALFIQQQQKKSQFCYGNSNNEEFDIFRPHFEIIDMNIEQKLKQNRFVVDYFQNPKIFTFKNLHFVFRTNNYIEIKSVGLTWKNGKTHTTTNLHPNKIIFNTLNPIK